MVQVFVLSISQRKRPSGRLGIKRLENLRIRRATSCDSRDQKRRIDITKFSTEFMDAIFNNLWGGCKEKLEELLRILKWAVLEKGMILRACKKDYIPKEVLVEIENLRIQQRKMAKVKEIEK